MNNVTEVKPQANRIFISYKRADLALVSKIKERIESELHETCWFDLDGIESRQQFRSKICKAIDGATVFLFMYSKSHLNIDFENDWTIKELDYAQTKKKIVVLVNIDNTPLDNLFLLDFGSKNNIDASDATQMKKLIKDLKGWLGIKEDQIVEDESNDIRIIRNSEKNRRYKLYVWLMLALFILSTIISLILIPSPDLEPKSYSDPTATLNIEKPDTMQSAAITPSSTTSQMANNGYSSVSKQHKTPTTIKYYEELASSGDRNSYAILAKKYLSKHDYDKAAYWANKAWKENANMSLAKDVIDYLSGIDYYEGAIYEKPY